MAAAALREFTALQGRRAEQYQRFDRGFERLLETGQLELYRQLCESVTAEFVAISQGVIAVEAALSGPLGRPDLAQALRHVQLAEKEKLQLVADYQRAQQRWRELDAANDLAGGETTPADEDEGERVNEDEDGTEVQLLQDAQVDARRCRQRVLDANEAISDMVAELRAELADLEES